MRNIWVIHEIIWIFYLIVFLWFQSILLLNSSNKIFKKLFQIKLKVRSFSVNSLKIMLRNQSSLINTLFQSTAQFHQKRLIISIKSSVKYTRMKLRQEITLTFISTVQYLIKRIERRLEKLDLYSIIKDLMRRGSSRMKEYILSFQERIMCITESMENYSQLMCGTLQRKL